MIEMGPFRPNGPETSTCFRLASTFRSRSSPFFTCQKSVKSAKAGARHSAMSSPIWDYQLDQAIATTWEDSTQPLQHVAARPEKHTRSRRGRKGQSRGTGRWEMVKGKSVGVDTSVARLPSLPLNTPKSGIHSPPTARGRATDESTSMTLSG